mmetsp:Transcript_32726/g.79528  ORF Transcript_32726/g.79528 Transcript_32726/m.79528 type:complete len:549 (-) Transcript_32726:177-1823(-)|eukprot:CAMPEP_0113521222 /NCGR_PEP_ID=MMETSP0014_2-20120614/44521_1 /TAXON_ID=2857 /ORGANISM="Nitzschia sp." /LENGTH=548 /DNA_ID=CAMNT_0000419159 /DNA_START=119 /DNA_END=1765 /DNA_ORIENTATION=+ /assembly_acc=CAM_ASM_000159
MKTKKMASIAARSASIPSKILMISVLMTLIICALDYSSIYADAFALFGQSSVLSSTSTASSPQRSSLHINLNQNQQRPPFRRRHYHHHTSLVVSTRLSSSSSNNDGGGDGGGKSYLYQRTFYRLSPNTDVPIPDALMIEERLRFASSPGSDEGDSIPVGPRTLILREGTAEDEITNEIFRIDLDRSDDKGSQKLDDEMMIASVLFMASNAHNMQGNVLELSSSTSGTNSNGAVATLGCIASQCAILANELKKDQLKAFVEQVQNKLKQLNKNDVADDVMTVPGSGPVESSGTFSQQMPGGPSVPFPQRMHKLTLSDENDADLQPIASFLKSQRPWVSPDKVEIEQVEWSTRRSTQSFSSSSSSLYRAIVGTDLNINFLSAKELARFIGYTLLPSNEFAVANIKSAAETEPSFGALGIDPEPSPKSPKEDFESEVDPSKPAMFLHLSPDRSGYISGTGSDDDITYLRQFLEKGYKMTVNLEYVQMQKLQFVPAPASSEQELDDMADLELQEESHRDYQTLTAIHHPDFAGEGMGEYFFPIETGAYEASR